MHTIFCMPNSGHTCAMLFIKSLRNNNPWFTTYLVLFIHYRKMSFGSKGTQKGDRKQFIIICLSIWLQKAYIMEVAKIFRINFSTVCIKPLLKLIVWKMIWISINPSNFTYCKSGWWCHLYSSCVTMSCTVNWWSGSISPVP